MVAACKSAATNDRVTPRGDVSIVRWLLIGQWRAQPGRLAAAALTIAIGVALALAIER